MWRIRIPTTSRRTPSIAPREHHGRLEPGQRFALAAGSFPQSVAIAVVNTTEPFATFRPQAIIDLDENAFVTFGSFTWYRNRIRWNSSSNGACATESWHLFNTIPAGSFRKNCAGGFTFSGVIDGIRLTMEIFPKGKSKYVFAALGKGANLAGTVNPVTIGVTIGDATGSASITASFRWQPHCRALYQTPAAA